MTCCILLLALAAAGSVEAAAGPAKAGPHIVQAPDDLVAELAAKVAAAIPASERVRVVAAADAAGDQARRRQLEVEFTQQLEARGAHADPAGATTVRVYCSTNVRERVCAAEIGHGESAQTIVVTGALSGAPAEAGEPRAILEMRHVFGQSDPILDVAQVGDRLIVLDPEKLTLYQRAAASWQLRRSQPVVSARVWPRDLRGRLRVSGASLEAFLPGAVCRANVDAFAVSCADERQAWPLDLENTGIASGRNYFTTPEGLGFFGSAPLTPNAGGRWLVATQNARLTLLDEQRRALEPAIGAADDVAGVAGCGAGAYALAGSGGAADGRDIMRLFRVADRRLVPAAAPLVLPGALTALWSAPGGAWATAIVRDPEAQHYDALEIHVACDR